MNKENNELNTKPTFPILGIDYGTKRIGLAVSDFKGILSTPIQTVSYSKNWGEAEIIEAIKQIIAEYNIKSICLGLPQKFTEAQQQNIDRITKFGEQLAQATGLKIYYYDESFSTKEAQNVLLSLGQNSKSSKSKIDTVAAALLLQNFLDSINNEN
ncbi:MAG: Holliday junction resolvase RuvX [Candidatus Dojkabacteria bacterium]